METLDLESEVEFDIDVVLPPELDAPWANEADVVELSPAQA